MQVVCRSKSLKLLRLGPISVLHNQPLQLVDRIKQVDSAAAICIGWLEEPDVVAIEQCVPHAEGCISTLAFIICLILLYIAVHVI